MPKRLRRSTTDRRVAGVLGGLAEYLGVRPSLVRAGFVLASIWLLAVGGGVVLYLIAWALVPEQSTDRSLAHDMFGGTPWANWDRAARSWVVVLGSLLLLSLWTFGFWPWWHWAAVPAWLLIAAVALWAFVRHQPGGRPGQVGQSPPRPGPWTGGAHPWAGNAPSGPPTAGPWGPVAGPPQAPEPGAWTVTPGGTVHSGTPDQEQSDRAAAELAARQWAEEQLAAAGVRAAPNAAQPSAQARHHNVLITMMAAVVVGLLLLAIVAVAGVVRWSGASFAGGFGNRAFAPAALAGVRSGYHLGAGNMKLDLSHVQFPKNGAIVDAEVGVGRLSIVVPNDAVVNLDAQTGVGNVDLPLTAGGSYGIWYPAARYRPFADDPHLTLRANVGVGNVNVSRAGSQL